MDIQVLSIKKTDIIVLSGIEENSSVVAKLRSEFEKILGFSPAILAMPQGTEIKVMRF